MSRLFKLLSISLTAVFVVGCASTPVLLDREALKQQPLSKIETNVPTNEIQIELSSNGVSSGGAGFGFLGAAVGALVDAGVNSSREKSMTDLRAAMSSYDFEAQFNSKLTAAINGTALENAEISKKIADTESAIGTPVLNMLFRISGDRLRLTVQGWSGFKNSDDKGDVYRKQYYSVHDLGKIGVDKKVKKRTAVLATKSEQLIPLLDSSIDEIVQLFIDDYTDNKIASLPATEHTSVFAGTNTFFPRMRIIQEDEQRALLISRNDLTPITMYIDKSALGKRKKIKKK